jgi:N-methylhydantoinase B
MSAIDPFTVEVIRHALTSAAEEMSLVVMRSARSPLLREAGDLSSAITDATGELVAQGHDVPIHLGVMSFTVKAFLERVPAARLRAGDVWILNLPEVGGNHLPDVKVIRPIFAEGRLVAFSAQLAHWADIGGAAPGSYYAAARDAWMEGLRIPPTRIFLDDQPEAEKIALILANVRGPGEREGDLMAQVAAARVADSRITEIAARHGVEALVAAMGILHARSEAQMREAIGAFPTASTRASIISTTAATATRRSRFACASRSPATPRRSTSPAATTRSRARSTRRASCRARRRSTR